MNREPRLGSEPENLHLLLQRDGRIHSFSQDAAELGAPVFDGLEAPSGSSKLAPPVPGGRGRLTFLVAVKLGCGAERERGYRELSRGVPGHSVVRAA